jgi:hypothetical protein
MRESSSVFADEKGIHRSPHPSPQPSPRGRGGLVVEIIPAHTQLLDLAGQGIAAPAQQV